MDVMKIRELIAARSTRLSDMYLERFSRGTSETKFCDIYRGRILRGLGATTSPAASSTAVWAYPVRDQSTHPLQLLQCL
jgi:hypothetical protein